MKNIFCFFIFLTACNVFNTSPLQAQKTGFQRVVLVHDLSGENVVAPRTFTQPLRNPAPFIALSAVWYGNRDISLQIRTSPDQRTWSDWQNCLPDEHADQTETRNTSVLLFLDQNTQFIQYKTAGDAPESIEWHFFTPGDIPAAKPRGDAESLFQATPPEGQNGDPCACPIPGFFTRSQWNCPDGDKPSCASPVYRPVTHLIVHHSAGANASNNWPAVVAAIWNYHVNTNQWCDVGYNWLIDPNGILYEGRGGGNDVVGAHMCGYNANTMGVCLLGNFMEVQPSEAALGTLQKLLAWKSCNAALNPLASAPKTSYPGVMQVISGHRDGCTPGYTLCPGDNLYSKLPALRPAVDTGMKACIATGTGEVSQVEVQLWPNPASGFAELRVPAGVIRMVELLDLTGRKVRQFQTPDDPALRLDLSGLAQGLYLVRVQIKNAGGVLSLKLCVL